jgi:hypothetical protein
MVPFVVPAGETRLFIRLSALATHTADMPKHPRVSLLATAEAGAAASPRTLARVTLQADAQTLARAGAHYAAARAADLRRFANADETLELGDFSIMALQPVSTRLVAGFGGAFSLAGDSLIDWPRQSLGNFAAATPSPGVAARGKHIAGSIRTPFAEASAARHLFDDRPLGRGHAVGRCSKVSKSPSLSNTSTASTTAEFGPRRAQAISRSTASREPEAVASTDPSRRLRTQPRIPRLLACSAIDQR